MSNSKIIVCVTACPTGIAHTYISAEMLKKVGQTLGYIIKVETHGAIGVENKLKIDDIDAAIGVIIAADIHVDQQRFKDKKIIEVSTREAIGKTKEVFNRLENII